MQTFKTSKAKENILGKIRKALNEEPVPMPFPEAEQHKPYDVFAHSEQPPEEVFADSFTKLGGKFVYCDNAQELLHNIHMLYDNEGWKQLYCSDERLLQLFQQNGMSDIVASADVTNPAADACITGCEYLVARTGSVLLSSKQHLGRTSTVFYPAHIIVAFVGQIADDIQQGIDLLRKKYGEALPSMINLNTGPSRTADIEKTLVVGVHGPGEVYCFYVNA